MANNTMKEHVLRTAQQCLALATELKEGQAVQRLQAALRDYQLGLFRLVVVGEIKKGKSSFINSLLGTSNLLPVASDVATSTVFKVQYGEQQKYKVFFLPDPEAPEVEPAPLEISVDQVAEYGTEDENPGNEKRVDFVGIELPHPLLQSGLVVIDTPGLGGLFREHADITWRYVPSADAVFFVLDSVEALMSKQEVESLQRLRKMTSLLFFVQTKIDLVDPEQWQQWRDRNLTILEEHLQVPKEKLFYFPLSAALKDLADRRQSQTDLDRSGFSPLLLFLTGTLIKVKDQQRVRVLLQALAAETLQFRRRLGDELQVFSTTSKEGLDTLERDFNAAKVKFEHWRTQEYQRAVNSFQDRSSTLKRETLDELQNRLDPSPNGPLLRQLIPQLRQREESAKQLIEQAKAIQSSCVDLCNQEMFEIQGQYNCAMQQLIGETVHAAGQAPLAVTGATVRGAVPEIADTLQIRQSGFDMVRSLFYGAGTVGSMATTAVVLTSLVFPPAAAAMLTSFLVGNVIGLIFSHRDLQARQKEEVLTKLQNLLVDTVRTTQRQAIQQFTATTTDYERMARQNFESWATEMHREYQEKLSSITEARKSTQEDSQRKALSLRQQVERTDALLRTIGQLGGQQQPSGSA